MLYLSKTIANLPNKGSSRVHPINGAKTEKIGDQNLKLKRKTEEKTKDVRQRSEAL